MKNKEVRIIMRTGQSGTAPEDRIIINYDINDFKDKTELTVAKLRTTMISSLRTYSHLKIIAEEQRKASASRAYLHTIIDSLTSVLVTLDFAGRILLWNREAEHWTGLAATEATGRNLFEVAPVFAPLRGLFQDLLDQAETGGPPRVERTAVPLWKGQQVFVHLILQILPGSTGPEILFRLDDRTLAKQQDDLVIRSQKVGAFSALASGIAGELTEVLRSEDGDPADRIRAWGLKASGLLERLARFSPLTGPGKVAVDWAALVRERIDARTLPAGLRIQFQAPGQAVLVGAHPQGLEALVENLLENAVDSMTSMPGAEGLAGPKTIDVTLELLPLGEEDRLRHPDLMEGPFWNLTIEDRGVGMGPETVNRVFDPYFTTKTSGLGLGLPLVYSQVESLGGFVDLTSVQGRGTTVRVGLPAWVEGSSEGTHQGYILVCDDEPMMRQVAGKILKHLGYQVLESPDGPGALDQFRSHPDHIRMVILDMVLPGTPGIEVFREIHKLAPGVPVLLSSGFGRGDGVTEALAEGVAGFLQKPYRAEALGQAVRQALEAHTSG
jgi:PAS domain S-box-containing protein